jgi:glycosyltransferase involved in cell wall biosynthesis
MRIEGYPLVSCILPTRNRSTLVRQAISYFNRQDYPSRELIVLDDGAEDLTSELHDVSRVSYRRLTTSCTIGAKRNLLCNLAKGEIIVHWDDDDWYSPFRLSVQLQPILAGEADITAFSDCLYYDTATQQFWRCDACIFRRMFVGNVHSGTLAYRRSLFERGIKYPDMSSAEDARFLYQCHIEGAIVRAIADVNHFIYVRHPRSTWQFRCGHHIDSRGWFAVNDPDLSPEDKMFLLSLTNCHALVENSTAGSDQSSA